MSYKAHTILDEDDWRHDGSPGATDSYSSKDKYSSTDYNSEKDGGIDYHSNDDEDDFNNLDDDTPSLDDAVEQTELYQKNEEESNVEPNQDSDSELNFAFPKTGFEPLQDSIQPEDLKTVDEILHSLSSQKMDKRRKVIDLDEEEKKKEIIKHGKKT